MKRAIVAVAVVLGVGMAGYALAQSAAADMRGGMMGHGQGMGQDARMGRGAMPMGGAMRSLMQGQPLTPEQLEQVATQHGITVEQAKQMTDTCARVMDQGKAAQTPAQ